MCRFPLLLCTAICLLLLCGCKGEPEEVKNAKMLVSKRMCKEALGPLEQALVQHADDARFHRSLCEAMLCVIADTDISRKERGEISEEKVRKHCKEGASDNSSVGFLRYALALQFLDGGDGAHAVLKQAAEEHDDDAVVRWFGTYRFFGRGPWGDAQLSEATEDLGDVVASVPNCLTNESGTTMVVKPSGAPVFVPGADKEERRFPPGFTLANTSTSGNRIQFTDTFAPHWKESTGWYLSWAGASETSSVYSGRCHDRMPQFERDEQLKPTEPWRCDGQMRGVDLPFDKDLIFREIPNKKHWKWIHAPKILHGCEFSEHAVDALDCLADSKNIHFNPNSPIEPTKRTMGIVSEEKSYVTHKTVWSEVRFQESDTPLREISLSDAWPINRSCDVEAVAGLVASNKKWPVEFLENVLGGTLKVGMPEQVLHALRFDFVGLYFDEDGLVTVWKSNHLKKDDRVIARNGRVAAKDK